MKWTSVRRLTTRTARVFVCVCALLTVRSWLPAPQCAATAGGTARAVEPARPTGEAELARLAYRHPDSASFHARLAAIDLADGTTLGRSRAIEHMKSALRCAPEDPEYHCILAEIYFESTFWGYGVKELVRAAELDPADASIHSRLGKAYLDRAFEEWQREWFARARQELGTAHALDSGLADASKWLALCYLDLGFPDSALALLEQVPHEAEHADVLLMLGMALAAADDAEASFAAFRKALSLMDGSRRRAYTSPELTVSPKEVKHAMSFPLEDLDAAERAWRRYDPNPATRVNERWVEHMARVSFADFHFSVPRLRKAGSETSRGEVYVRFGRPLAWAYDAFGTNTFAGETVLPVPGLPRADADPADRLAQLASSYRSRTFRQSKSRWVWQYEGFTLDFEDTFLNGDYEFPYERDWSAYTYAYLEEHVPQIYEIGVRQRMRVVLDALNFIDPAGRQALKLVYACDTRGIRFVSEYELPRGDFEVEVAVLDSNYSDLARASFTEELSADSTALYQTAYPIIATWIARVPPGSCRAAVSVQSKVVQSAGFATRDVRVRGFGRDLELSDIELRFADHGPPNPSHVYRRRGNVYLAFSIYNVKTDASGTGEVGVEYSLSRRPERVPLLERLRHLVGGNESAEAAGEITSLRSGYRLKTRGPIADEVIGIDLSSLSAGDYEVAVTASDQAGGTARVSTYLTIASDKDAD